IGAPVVYIEAGTFRAPAIAPGDTLSAAGNPDLEIAASKTTQSLEQLPVIIANSKTIIANASATGSRVSAIYSREKNNATLSTNASRLMAKTRLPVALALEIGRAHV